MNKKKHYGNMITDEGIIKVPNYNKCFSYIDKGIPLYYFHLYKPIKLTTKLQVIDALSKNLSLCIDVDEEWFKDI